MIKTFEAISVLADVSDTYNNRKDPDMITTLSAYKEMLLASSGGKTDVRPQNGRKALSAGADPALSSSESANPMQDTKSSDAVSVDLSASHDVFSAVDDFFNLGRSGRFDAFHKLSPEDKEQFVKIVAELAKSGYIGFEELVVNKKVERHEITSQIGDDRLRNARVYDKSKYPRR